MRPIPIKMRNKIAADPFMKVCIYESDDAPNHNCEGNIEFEHAWLYAGKQINEPWAIVPCCTSHNRGEGLDKNYNRYRALKRAVETIGLKDLQRRMPKKNWQQEWNYLRKKYLINNKKTNGK